MSAGDSIEDVLVEYPSLARDDVFACLAYESERTGRRPPPAGGLRMTVAQVTPPTCFGTPSTTAPTADAAGQ